uniref:Uncharacterized protein n=1 Tax=Anopheles farauti TaxID=69004 RepID=A0A182QTV1_9DIPT
MQHKIDIDSAILADYVKQSSTSTCYRKVFYTFAIVSAIGLGAFTMALLYHWNEFPTNGRRLEGQEMQEMIRLAEVLLSKHDVEKLLVLFQQAITTGVSQQHKTEKDFESNLTVGKAKHTKPYHPEIQGKGDILPSAAGPAKPEHHEVVLVEQETESLSQDHVGTGESTEEDPDEEQDTKIFNWKWTIPNSAWLQLSPFFVSYGTSNESSENKISTSEQQ